MSYRILRAGALLALALALVSGCGRGSNKQKFAFISNNNHGFWTYAQRGCEKAAKELDVDVEFKRPDPGTLAQQQQIIEDLLERRVLGIAVSPNDPSNMAAFLKSKVIAKVPVVAADNDLPDLSARKVYVGTHNYLAGRAAGDLVKKALPKGGTVAIFVGDMAATNAKERRQGVLDVLAGIDDRREIGDLTPADATNVKFGDYILLETRTDGGKETTCQEKAEDFLGTPLGSKVDCLVGLWEYNPPALLRAVNSVFKGARKPVIVAFDENFKTMEAIKSGDIVGSVAQDPFTFGYLSIKVLHAIHKGEDIKKVVESVTAGEGGKLKLDADNRVYIPHTVVGPHNVDAFFARLKDLRGE